MLALLLAYGAQMEISEEDASKAVEKSRAHSNHNYYYSPDVKQQIHKPLETSIALADEVVQLLLSLGAEPSAMLRTSHQWTRSPRRSYQNLLQTVLDRTRSARRGAEKKVREDERAALPEAKESAEELTGWIKFAKELTSNQWASEDPKPEKTPQQEKQERDQKRDNRDLRDYLVQLEKLLLAQGAKTWAQLEGEEEDDDDEKYKHEGTAPPAMWDAPGMDGKKKENEISFFSISDHYSRQDVPEHTKPLYHQLFDAAWAGNNEKIEELCLPKEKTPVSQSILQVSVKAQFGTGDHYGAGITPLLIAALAGHWETSRLILAIAAAQYKKPDDEPFSTSGLYLDDDDDDGSSVCSDDTEQGDRSIKPTSFKDISQRASAVQCSCSPITLITHPHVYFVKKKSEPGANTRRASLLRRSIETDDLQLFTQLADLYASVSAKLEDDGMTIVTILQRDLPDHLDECIRRTGRGIRIDAPKDGEDDIPQIINDENKLYLGLKVHGKKRADLATANDPNGGGQYSDCQDREPLVWRAVSSGALKIIGYLNTDRPVEAYRFYAKSKGDEKALRLRKVESELPTILPSWLGWAMSPLRESALTAGVMSGSLEALKKIFAVAPKLAKDALHEKIKFSGMNLMNVAVLACSAGPDIFDFLLAKHVSPVEIMPATGFNILHELASQGTSKNKLLEHILKKLPRDTVEALMVQQSKNYNTPLHLAVKNGNIFGVTVLLPFTPNKVFLLRDVLGNTVLHIAVGHSRTYAKITQLLLSHPSAPTSKMLYMENGLGDTPLDTLALTYLLRTTREVYPKPLAQIPAELRISYSSSRSDAIQATPPFAPSRLDHLKTQLPLLRQTLTQLTEEGKIQKGSKFLTEWLSWLSMMEARSGARAQELAGETVVGQQSELEKAVAEREATDSSDVEATLKCVLEAIDEDASHSMLVDSSPVKRGLTRSLVHLADVQTAVRELIKKSNDEVNETLEENRRQKNADDALAAEDAEDEQKDAMTQYLGVGQVDTL